LKAQVLYGKKELKLVNREIAKIKNDEVLIRLRASGICRSDIEFYQFGKVGSFEIQGPMVLGHESAGEIEEIGPGVTDLKKGDRVAIDPLISCGTCDSCSRGFENLCLNKIYLAAPPYPEGCFQEYLVHPAKFVVKVDDSVTFEESSMIEPASVVYHAADQMETFKGKNRIGVMGAGSIGLVLCKILNLNDNNEIFLFDIDEKRIEFAVKRSKKVKGFVAGRQEDQFPTDLNMGFDTTGSERAINSLTRMIIPRGKISCIGWGAEIKSINFHRIVLNELEIRGSQVFTHAVFKKVADILKTGELDLKDIYSGGYSLEDLEDLFLSVDRREIIEPKVILSF
jgi:L-iditol 2-dehydrogenase